LILITLNIIEQLALVTEAQSAFINKENHIKKEIVYIEKLFLIKNKIPFKTLQIINNFFQITEKTHVYGEEDFSVIRKEDEIDFADTGDCVSQLF